MHVREATPADRDAILELRARCFGDVDPEKRDPRFWEWEFADARCFVGEENGQLLTHFALVRMPHASALAVDAMTAPAARGKGAFSRVVAEAMRATAGEFELATAYQIRSAVLGAMLRGGWSIAASVPVLVRPAPLFPIRPDPRIRTLTRDDVPAMARIARTAEFLAWRYFDNPHWHYRVTGVGDVAYLVARRTTLKGFDTYAIVDLAFTDRAAARLLLREAVGEAKRIGCRLAAALVSWAHPAFPLFLMRGFVPGPHRFRLLVFPNIKRRWRVMWGDTDHL